MYEILRSCFHGLYITPQLYERTLGSKSNVFLTEHCHGAVAGFSVLRGPSILMLCVLPEYRRRGIGTRLLARSEAYIAARGAGTVILGCGDDYLFQGVPVSYGAVPFFEKRGYFADWVSADLTLNLSQYSTPNIPPSPYDIRFGLPSDKVHAQNSNAVEEVDSDWISYFAVPNAPVFAAWRNENLAGFLLLDDHADVPYCPFDARVGTIGCVGVLRDYRKQGIGLRMVDAATRELIARGCAWAHIGYTHLSHWYGRIGYQVCMEFWMGEKRLLN